jgi:hypothetical protein
MNALMKKLPLMRSCKEVTALVIAREDRELPLTEQLALRMHMAICKACPVFERQIRTTRHAMKQWRNYGADDESAS